MRRYIFGKQLTRWRSMYEHWTLTLSHRRRSEFNCCVLYCHTTIYSPNVHQTEYHMYNTIWHVRKWLSTWPLMKEIDAFRCLAACYSFFFRVLHCVSPCAAYYELMFVHGFSWSCFVSLTLFQSFYRVCTVSFRWYYCCSVELFQIFIHLFIFSVLFFPSWLLICCNYSICHFGYFRLNWIHPVRFWIIE